MIRRLTVACGVLLALAGLSGCGNDSVAGKTTTTGNGGGLVALGPDGQALSGCVVLAARSWDPVRGVPGIVDTVRGDAAGILRLPQETYAFLEIQDSGRTLGAWAKRVLIPEGSRRTMRLDTMRSIEGSWADRAGIVEGRIYLDSSFRSAPLRNADGRFSFGRMPSGDYSVKLDADAKALRSMGMLQIVLDDVRYVGAGNIVVAGDMTGSPLLLDDFESGSNLSRLHDAYPDVSPWYMWWTEVEMFEPLSSRGDSMSLAIRSDASRPGRSFHSRFKALQSWSWLAVGIAGLRMDMANRSQLCFSYRCDTAFKVQLQRDSVGTVRPALFASIPSSVNWRDLCLETTSLVAEPGTPDSLSTWASFGKRVLTLEFHVPGGGSYLELDDIFLR
jgi:hypothetical protein